MKPPRAPRVARVSAMLAAAIFAALLAATSALLAAVPASAAPTPCTGATETTVQYAAPGGEALSMDAFLPAQGDVHPAVLVIHGGGWFTGTRTEWDPVACLLAQNGVAGFSVDYRLAPRDPYPAALEDLQAAVRFLRANASMFEIDGTHIGALGGSAGGHLAALLAVAGRGPTDAGSRIAVAVSWSGPTDLLTMLEGAPPSQRTTILQFVGCHDPKATACRDRLLAASPITYVDRTDPPLFLANSAHEAIPLSQPNAMAEVLTRDDRLYRLDVLPGSRHSAEYAGDVEEPSIAFLRQYLGLASPPAIPSHQAYLGAMVNPQGARGPATMRREVLVLERSMGRTLAVDEHAHGWRAPFPGDAERFDLARGRIPMVAWGCVDPSDIAGGGQDSLIAARADAVGAYGAPVLLAFGMDMDRGNCAGAKPGPFKSAWRHIWRVFQAHGVANVAWVWCPSAGGFPDADRFYPGRQFVDWACADGSSGVPARPFAQVFDAFYRDWAGRKPLLVSTGAAFGVAPGQATYIEGAEASLKVPMAGVRALVWRDAPGPVDSHLSAGGLRAFRAMGADPYFAPTP
ncbi:MAG: alpha/beta hydrolase fold domain-containing protein [Actinomycetota bacterium]|nr:alpha/beta hydrolase fold domain-containing protein [Actinomycetota bacterium]